MISIKTVERANGRVIISALNQIDSNPTDISKHFGVSDSFMRRTVNGNIPVTDGMKVLLEELCLSPEEFKENHPIAS